MGVWCWQFRNWQGAVPKDKLGRDGKIFVTHLPASAKGSIGPCSRYGKKCRPHRGDPKFGKGPRQGDHNFW